MMRYCCHGFALLRAWTINSIVGELLSGEMVVRMLLFGAVVHARRRQRAKVLGDDDSIGSALRDAQHNITFEARQFS